MAMGIIVYVPNIITITRCSCSRHHWLIVADKPFTAFVVFLIAGLTDAVDGSCRRFGWKTELGAYWTRLRQALLMRLCGARIYGHLPAGRHSRLQRDMLIIGSVFWLAGLDRTMPVHPHSSARSTPRCRSGLRARGSPERGLALG